MQRNLMIGTQPNAHSLEDLPADELFWQGKDIMEIRLLLKDALILKSGTTALPEHTDLQALLNAVSQRVIDLVDDALVSSVFGFVEDPSSVRFDQGKSLLGECYLQIMSVLNFYSGHYEHAAKPLAALGNVYFLCARIETETLSAHFNYLAALAFRETGDIKIASQHYNQYLARTGSALHTPEDVHAATTYLLENQALVSTDGLLVVLQKMIDKSSDNDSLKYGLKRQLDRAEGQVMYMDLDRRKPEAALKEARQQLESLKTVASVNRQHQQRATQAAGTLFASKEGVPHANAVKPETPRPV